MKIRDKVNRVLVRADNLRHDPEYTTLDTPRQEALELFVARLREINRSEHEAVMASLRDINREDVQYPGTTGGVGE